MKQKHPFLIVCLLLSLCGCKKIKPDDALKISSTEAYMPNGYSIDQYSKRTVIGTFNGKVNDIVVDTRTSGNAFIIGKFNTVNSNGLSTSIVQFSSGSNTFSRYPVTFALNSDIRSFYQRADDGHYLGGTIMRGANTYYLCFKEAGAIDVIRIGTLDGSVNVIKPAGQNIYFAGDFSQLENTYCSPLLYYNGFFISNYGPARYTNFNTSCIETDGISWYLSGVYAYPGYVYSSAGTSWMSNVGGGFDYMALDMLMFNNTLYAGGYMRTNSNGDVNLNYVVSYTGSSWASAGVNNLPASCSDLEVNNGKLYACGGQYIYYLNGLDNTWKNAVVSTVSSGSVSKIKFINGKLYTIEDGNLLVLYER